MRHPLYTGFFIAYEERDLLALFGEEYAAYQRQVGAFIPGIGKKG